MSRDILTTPLPYSVMYYLNGPCHKCGSGITGLKPEFCKKCEKQIIAKIVTKLLLKVCINIDFDYS